MYIRHTLATLTLAFTLHAAPQDDQYVLGPDSQVRADVPQGKVTQMPAWKDSKIFPGTSRDWWIYVPAQYSKDKPAAVMVFCDGGGFVKADGQFRAPVVFDNLIAKGEMPVTIGIFIQPGTFPTSNPKDKARSNRSLAVRLRDDTATALAAQERTSARTYQQTLPANNKRDH